MIAVAIDQIVRRGYDRYEITGSDDAYIFALREGADPDVATMAWPRRWLFCDQFGRLHVIESQRRRGQIVAREAQAEMDRIFREHNAREDA